MRIVSWNVNGIRAATKKGFGDYLAASDADVIALQETRARTEQVPPAVREPEGWWSSFVAAERGGYSGVGLYARKEPDEVRVGLGVEEFDIEGRLVWARFGELWVVNGYFPNGSGKNRDHSRVPYKLNFYQELYRQLEADKASGKRILVMGDFNTAFAEIDLARPKANHKTSGFLPNEREELGRWFEGGWVDTFRHFEKGEGHYTWWSQRFGVRQKNIGWRIDYVLASPGAMEFVTEAAIHPDVMGSDHCPISVTLKPSVTG